MSVRPLDLLVLLAVGVAMLSLRASATHHVGHPPHDGHGHTHEHFHGDHAHSHGHHHHGEREDGDPDDHHGVVDHLPDGPKLIWAGPRRTEIDPPPALPMPPTAALASTSNWQPIRRAKPPPRPELAPRHLNSIRTIILRL
jgi:hypothetical protein